MPEAARVGDTIGHSSAMAGLMAGTVIGSLISAAGGILSGALFVAGLAASCIGVGVLLIGAAIAVSMATGYLGDMARDACVSGGGLITKSLRGNHTRFPQCVYQQQTRRHRDA